jgi:branched-chain amino acid aminotransferase
MAISIKINKTQQSRIDQCDFENIEFGKIFSDHMFKVDYLNGAWQEPEIIPYGPILMAPSISALHYGQAIFEGMKAFKSPNGDALLFRPMDNIIRLNESAIRMGMPEIPVELFLEGLKTLVSLEKDWIPTKDGSALYLRPFMFATDDFVGVRPSVNYSFIIFCCPVNSYYPKPIKVMVEENFVRASDGMAGFAKAAGNYGISMLPTIEAKKKGYDQIIWTDGRTHEYVEESGTTNLFFIINDETVWTPTLDGNILRGVTRDSCIQLLKQRGLKIEERKITVKEVLAAAESGTLTDCFGTGTAAIIAKIAAIGYKGKDYILPEAENRVISNWIYSTMYGIQTGKVKDDFNWVLTLK